METKDWSVAPLHEFRFEVLSKSIVTITVTKGEAEIMGAEIINSTPMQFTGCKVAVFSYTGCELTVIGEPSVAYISGDTPMGQYLNAHAVIQQMRAAAKTGSSPPRVMVVGQQDSGKSSFCKILLNYAVREQAFPLFLDLDLAEGSYVLPGTLSCIVVNAPIAINKSIPSSNIMSIPYGHLTMDGNAPIFNMALSRLNDTVSLYSEKDPVHGAAGCVIDTGVLTKEQIISIRAALNASVVIVMDSERLFAELQQSMDKLGVAGVHVVRLPKSPGVVTSSSEERSQRQSERFRQYFYGGALEEYLPKRFEVPFDSIRLLKLGAPAVPLACLPIGVDPTSTDTKVISIPWTKDCAKFICAISSIPDPLRQTDLPEAALLLDHSILGFVCIEDVDVEKRKVVVLSPAPFPLPRQTLIQTSLQTFD